jgi:glycosyltransferase involved in cell wall biosynthesis
VKRKGLDVLIKAYVSTFTHADDVTLIVHSIYTWHASSDFILSAKRNKTAPEIIFMNHTLSEMDMIRLYKSVDVYVTPYRSEGFGKIEKIAIKLKKKRIRL